MLLHVYSFLFTLTSKVATHHGEIYLESCRGCYTTQAKTKLANRKAEFLLNELEFLATIASVHENSWTYPKRALDNLWQTVLLCHFHDVLPGSAIYIVFEDASKVSQVFSKINFVLTTFSFMRSCSRRVHACTTKSRANLKWQEKVASLFSIRSNCLDRRSSTCRPLKHWALIWR